MIRITRRGALTAATALLAAPAVHAQGAYPNRPIRLIVPYPPAGVTDIMGRLAAEAMGRQLGQTIVVENRGGAGGNIGTKAAAQAEPDGYTLLLATNGTQGMNPVVYPDPSFDPRRDLVGIGALSAMANLLICNPRRWNPANAAEAIARCKAEPGKILFASVGNGSSSHLSQSLLVKMAGLDVVHVPYRGSAAAVTAMIAGEVDLLFDTTTTSTAHVQAGAVKALAVTSRQRFDMLPDVPSLDEQGVTGYNLSAWLAVMTQSRVPAPILARLQQAFERSMDATMQERLKANYAMPLKIPTAELPAWLASESELWGRIARESGIQAG